MNVTLLIHSIEKWMRCNRLKKCRSMIENKFFSSAPHSLIAVNTEYVFLNIEWIEKNLRRKSEMRESELKFRAWFFLCVFWDMIVNTLEVYSQVERAYPIWRFMLIMCIHNKRSQWAHHCQPSVYCFEHTSLRKYFGNYSNHHKSSPAQGLMSRG